MKSGVVLNSALFPVYVLLMLVAMIAAINALPEEKAVVVVREGGVVESLSAYAWFVAAAVIVVRGGWRSYVLCLLPLFCGMRELDLHKEWTTDSVLKSKFYLGDHVGAPEKLIAFFVLLIFIIALVYVCVSYGRLFVNNIRAWEWRAINLSLALSLLFVSKIFLDGMKRKLASIGVEIDAPFVAMITEETMEMVAALLVLMVSISWVREKLKLG